LVELRLLVLLKRISMLDLKGDTSKHASGKCGIISCTLEPNLPHDNPPGCGAAFPRSRPRLPSAAFHLEKPDSFCFVAVVETTVGAQIPDLEKEVRELKPSTAWWQ